MAIDEEKPKNRNSPAGEGKLAGIAAIITALGTLAAAVVPLAVGTMHSKGEPNQGVVQKYKEGVSVIVNNVFKARNNPEPDRKSVVLSRDAGERTPPSKPLSSPDQSTATTQPPALSGVPPEVKPTPPQEQPAVSCLGLPAALKLVHITADWAKPNTYLIRMIVQNASDKTISLLSGGSEQLTDDDKNRIGFLGTSLLRRDYDSREQRANDFFKAGVVIEPQSESSNADKAAKRVSVSSNLFYITPGAEDKFIPNQRNFTCEDIPLR